MLGLRALFVAIARVTSAVNGIATTAEEVNARWRAAAALDGPSEVENAPVLTDTSATMPIATPRMPLEGLPEEPPAVSSRNGRKRQATA